MAHPAIERGLERIVVAGEDRGSVAESAVTRKRPYGVHVHQFIRCAGRHRGLIEIDIAQQICPFRSHVTDFKDGVRHDFALHRNVIVRSSEL